MVRVAEGAAHARYVSVAFSSPRMKNNMAGELEGHVHLPCRVEHAICVASPHQAVVMSNSIRGNRRCQRMSSGNEHRERREAATGYANNMRYHARACSTPLSANAR